MTDPPPKPVLYLGDTAIDQAASYLAGVLHHAGLGFDYLPSNASAADAVRADQRKLIILSDYPADQLDDAGHDAIVQAHRHGAGLLMIGGWESFHGVGGDWDRSPVADLLPVVISDADDRINHDQGALVRHAADHPITDGLPWDERPPAVGGYSRFAAKPGALTVLEVVRQRLARDGDQFVVTGTTTDPMLVVADAGPARAATLATDAAPHWVGPLVDWGTDNDAAPSGGGRVACQAPGANAVEVGQHYARFFTQLVRWTGLLDH